ncbi:MAG: sigma-54 dependent transcriptional regulator [Bacteroidales bacterium]|nr:sigma-54 dependent transcriptional regulator [Bacteroidales bacterium]
MKPTGSVLIVDDNKDVLSALEVLLEDEFENLKTITNPNQIPFLLQSENFDAILLDMNFSSAVNTGNEGIYWLKQVMTFDPDIVVIMFTAFGDVSLAVRAMKEGATDFVLKPWDNDKMVATLKAGIKLYQSRKETQKLKNQKLVLEDQLNKYHPEILGSSDIFNRIREVIDKTAPTDANILLTGENGTGKSIIAREIHHKSSRKNEPFVVVDLGSISESLFESELFGYKKGAFTDAKEDRTGRIESANGGTLFLDEIGNLSPAMQVKLLNVLQEKMITPLGSSKSIPVNIRLITATNQNLEGMLKNKNFREDLYYRINTISIEIPPLRDRSGDIENLAESFFDQFKVKYHRSNLIMGPKYLERLKQHSWPGNIRELEHSIEQSVILADGDELLENDFHIKDKKMSSNHVHSDGTLEEIEKRAILNALKKHSGSPVKAARELNITRQTIHNKIKRYGL